MSTPAEAQDSPVDEHLEAVDLADDVVIETPAEIELPARRGPSPHRRRMMGRTFTKVSVDGAPTTTRQAEVLNTAVIGTPTDERGVVIGEDRVSGALVMHDTFTAYQNQTITSPNVCVLGMIGSGKALDVDTLIVTPGGWRRMGDLAVGEEVFDETGRPTAIVAVSEVMTDRPCLAVTFLDGSVVVADREHLWATSTHPDRVQSWMQAHRTGGPVPPVPTTVRSTGEIAATLIHGKAPSIAGTPNHAVKVAAPLDMPSVDLPIDPYVLGAWLRNGARSGTGFTVNDPEVAAFVEGAGYDLDAGAPRPGKRAGTFSGDLDSLGVLNTKDIPRLYLWAGTGQRLDLLQGLLDSNGTITRGGTVKFSSTNRRLVERIRQLCCSLGYAPVLTGQSVEFAAGTEVFRSSSKQMRLKGRTGTNLPGDSRYRHIVDVQEVPSRPVRCIQVAAASSMYLAGPAMIPTHNSSLLKTVYVERPLMLRKRRAVVIDKKVRDGEGEYAELTRLFGSEPYRFNPDDRDSTCMNLMDPIITGGGKAQSRQLLTAFAELAGDGSPLTEWHEKAISVAYAAVMAEFEDSRRVPVLPDLIGQFPGVVKAPRFAGLRDSTRDLIEQAAMSVQFRMERLIDDDLAGMFDRETSAHVKLQPKLTTFDISALPEDGPATSMVMLVANAWLTGLLTRDPGWLTNFIAEEGWHLLSGPGGRVIRSKSKLSRGLGLAIVAAIHHISDIPKDSDAIAMIKEAQTIHLYRQEHDDDIADCVRYFNLERSNADALGQLPQGDHLLKVGTTREIRVRHVRTSREVAFTATDSAMSAAAS